MLQLCNIARNILREVVFCNLSHSGTRKMCLNRIYHINRFSLSWAFCTCNLFSGLFCLVVYYNWLQKYLRHCTVFWLKWPVHDLLLVIPAPSTPYQSCQQYKTMLKTWRNNFESHRPVTSTDLKQERSFFRQTVSIFCNWLKLLVEKSIIKSWRHGRRTRIPNEKKRPNTMRVLYLLSSWDPLGEQSQLQGSYLTGVLYTARINNVDSLFCVDK